MQYLKIQNDKELPIELVSLMGGTTKSKDDRKIGQFGTGLKYTLAYLIRNNIDYKIFIGERELKIETKMLSVRGGDFEVIYIDGEKTSVTTNMGMDWQAWMIVREIWCNALDEGGAKKEITDQFEGEKGKTVFYLQNVGDIKNVVDNWSNYFLTANNKIYDCEGFSLYPGGETIKIYKQGILIHEKKSTDKKSIFSYDIKGARLNELREFRPNIGVDHELQDVLLNIDDPKIIDKFLSELSENTYEYEFDYGWFGSFNSEAYRKAIGEAKIISRRDFTSLKERGADIHEGDLVLLPQSLYKRLSADIEGISALRRSGTVNSFYEQYDEEFEKRFKEAMAILEACGYEIDHELTFLFGVFGNKKIYGKINLDEKTVMLSTELKRMNRFRLISTIIEENEHYITGHSDLSREFQDHFISLYAKEILERNEVKL